MTIGVYVYIDSIGSANESYFVNEDTDHQNSVIVVCKQRPQAQTLQGENPVENYLRHCDYVCVAEHRATRLYRIEADSMKRLKDDLRRSRLFRQLVSKMGSDFAASLTERLNGL